jgi:hypothetical protein
MASVASVVQAPRQIHALVYELYGVTEEKIAILEARQE